MRKGTFRHMQKVQTQTSRSVSDAVTGQGLHFLSLVINDTYISSCVNNLITYRCFQHVVGADLGLQYL